MKMVPVIASTKIDNPNIEWAGVDAGAKILVGLEKVRESATQVVARQNKVDRTFRAGRSIRLVEYTSCTNSSCLEDLEAIAADGCDRRRSLINAKYRLIQLDESPLLY
jgi:hypothetical protein